MTRTVTTDEGYDPSGSLLARYSGTTSSNTRLFVPFNGGILAEYYLSPTAGTLFDHPDEIGSVTASTSYNGSSCQDRLYYPYGELFNGAGNCGMHQEFAKLPDYDPETDQYNTANRHYSPAGRWLTPDPVEGHLEDPQTLNKYAYVRNSPTVATDPSGQDLVWGTGDRNAIRAALIAIASTDLGRDMLAFLDRLTIKIPLSTGTVAGGGAYGKTVGLPDIFSQSGVVTDVSGGPLNVTLDFPTAAADRGVNDALRAQGQPPMDKKVPATDAELTAHELEHILAAIFGKNLTDDQITALAQDILKNKKKELQKTAGKYVDQLMQPNGEQAPSVKMPSAIREDAQRQCALGNPAACGY